MLSKSCLIDATVFELWIIAPHSKCKYKLLKSKFVVPTIAVLSSVTTIFACIKPGEYSYKDAVNVNNYKLIDIDDYEENVFVNLNFNDLREDEGKLDNQEKIATVVLIAHFVACNANITYHYFPSSQDAATGRFAFNTLDTVSLVSNFTESKTDESIQYNKYFSL